MLRQPRSLQGRLLLLTLSLVACVWGVSAVSTWFTVRQQLGQVLDGHLAQAAALLVVRESLEPDGDHHEERHDLRAPALQAYAPQVAFQVFHDDRLAARSANAPAVPMVPLGAAFQGGFSSLQIGSTAWRLYAVQDDDQDLRVVVGEQQHARAAIVWAVLESTIWPALLALPLLGLAVWWSARHGMAPLRELGVQLALRSPQASQPCEVADAPAEMLPMLGALNGLFQRIAGLRAAEQRFTADAAHELRTPIAAIRTQAQVALGELDEAKRCHALQSTIAGCDRATRLVAQLLTLSRIEAGGGAPATSPVELVALTRNTLAELAPVALAKGQTLALDAPPACRVLGDATLLTVLLRNLLDNAIRYSPGRANVQVQLRRVQGRVQLEVDDSGPGLGDADLPRFGERFFRVLGSGQAGSGLGGSIVQRIAAAHGASVRVARSPTLGGLQVTVEWPSAASDRATDSLPPAPSAPPLTQGPP